MFGILNINKPPELTSRQVVDHVVRLVKPAKAGHAGTLDPLATGVLVVCVGPATRLISHVQAQRKEYRATFLLGRRSNTDDVTGEVEEVPVAEHPGREQIQEFLQRFIGKIEQVPPQFSAVHVDGQRAYKLARKGETVEIAARTVEIHRNNVVRYEFPELVLDVECGSGTYIRSLGRDLGKLLGCGAVMSELVRTRIGPFRLESATALDELTADSMTEHLLPAVSAVRDLPRRTVSEDELQRLRNGLPIPVSTRYQNGELVAVMVGEDQLACLAEFSAARSALAPKQVFVR